MNVSLECVAPLQVHFAQWFQSDEAIDLEMVEADVENIALKTLENLHLKRPTHSIFNLDKIKADKRCGKPIHASHLMAGFLFPDAKPHQVRFTFFRCESILDCVLLNAGFKLVQLPRV